MKLKLKQLCESANGMVIVYDPIDSHTATHFQDTPELISLAREILQTMNLDEELVAKDFDTGKIVGNSNVVKVKPSDEIVYAIRKNREDQGYVPFTRSRSSEPSSLVSMYLKQFEPGTYELQSIWIGSYESPPFPQMNNATAESIPYWTKHAFVWGSQEIIPGTVVNNCPW
jgi:hypothetical protein